MVFFKSRAARYRVSGKMTTTYYFKEIMKIALLILTITTGSFISAMQKEDSTLPNAKPLEALQLTVDRNAIHVPLSKEQLLHDICLAFNNNPEINCNVLDFRRFLLAGFNATSCQNAQELLKRYVWFNENQLRPMRKARLQAPNNSEKK